MRMRDVVEGEQERDGSVRREVEVEATPEEVWESLATEEGRDRWLEDDPEREIHVERADEPSRLVWWWWSGDEPATRVEFLVVAAPAGARVVVTETAPSFAPSLVGLQGVAAFASRGGPRFPLGTFTASFASVAA
jgi:uncharacterized protein YndB with AHSA1/START domain